MQHGSFDSLLAIGGVVACVLVVVLLGSSLVQVSSCSRKAVGRFRPSLRL